MEYIIYYVLENEKNIMNVMSAICKETLVA